MCWADAPFQFDVLPENAAQEDGLTVITLTAPNSPTQISVAKVDYQGTFVAGATLQLLDKDGNVAAEWVTGDVPHILYGLPIGAAYTLHEAAAPEGWLLAEDMTFTVQDTAEVQTITMEDERVPELHTTATVDGSHEVVAIGPVTLTDTVAYRNLIPGRAYTITGSLMLKSTGKPLMDAEGQPITSSVTFTPETADGEVEVVFTFDAKLLGGESVVVFEEISREGRTFATHADLEDEGQTVRFQPAIGTVTIKDKPSFGGVQTGDSGVTVAVLGLLPVRCGPDLSAAAQAAQLIRSKERVHIRSFSYKNQNKGGNPIESKRASADRLAGSAVRHAPCGHGRRHHGDTQLSL